MLIAKKIYIYTRSFYLLSNFSCKMYPSEKRNRDPKLAKLCTDGNYTRKSLARASSASLSSFSLSLSRIGSDFSVVECNHRPTRFASFAVTRVKSVPPLPSSFVFSSFFYWRKLTSEQLITTSRYRHISGILFYFHLPVNFC